jgi:hypothetical protein
VIAILRAHADVRFRHGYDRQMGVSEVVQFCPTCRADVTHARDVGGLRCLRCGTTRDHRVAQADDHSAATRRVGMWIAIGGGAVLLILIVLLAAPSHPKITKPPADAAVAREEVDAVAPVDPPLPNADMPDPPRGTRDEWANPRREQPIKHAMVPRAARVEFVRTLAGGIAANGDKFPFTVRLGDPDTTLEIISDGCWSKLLDAIIENTGDHIRNVGFTRIVCVNGRGERDL